VPQEGKRVGWSVSCWIYPHERGAYVHLDSHTHESNHRHSVLIDDRIHLKAAWEAKGGIFIHHTDTESTLKELRERNILTTFSPAATTKETATIETAKEHPVNETTATTKEIATVDEATAATAAAAAAAAAAMLQQEMERLHDASP
jgi:hypothetical protein